MATCKFCQAELKSDSTVCPSCGKDNAAQPSANEAVEAELESQRKKKKLSGGIIALIAVGVIAIIAALVILIGKAAQPKNDVDTATPPGSSVSDTDSTDDADGTDGADSADSTEDEVIGDGLTVASKKDYSVSADLLTPDSDLVKQVVATVGDETLTNGVFQIYYWMQLNSLMNTYGEYMMMLGLDTSVDLAQQASMEPFDPEDEDSEMMTWEQYFIEAALDAYQQQAALAQEADAVGHQMAEEDLEYLDSLVDELQEAAVQNGWESAEAYLQISYGSGVSVEDFKTYVELYMKAYSYAASLQEVEYTPEDVEAYFDENEAYYSSNGVTKDDHAMINVRHILIMPEVDKDTDDDGEPNDSSDAAWAAAEQKANEIYKQWKEDPTEDHFAELAGSESEDPGSVDNGGLYESVYPGQMVTEFNDWCFDDARQPGDTAIVRTDYGYHVMYYVDQTDEVYWYQNAENDYIYQIYSDRLDEIFAKYELKANYNNIAVNKLTYLMQAAQATQ